MVKDIESAYSIKITLSGKTSSDSEGFAGGKGNVVFKSLRDLHIWGQINGDVKATSYTFPALRKVTHVMNFQTQSSLESISLPALLIVHWSLAIKYNIKLTKLSLPVLQYAGEIDLTNNAALAGSGTDIFINPDTLFKKDKK